MFLQQFGNSKIQQFYPAITADEHVRGLDVTMHDQVGVRQCDGGEDIEKKADLFFHAELLAFTIPVNRFAIDIFQNQIWLPCCGNASIEQLGDIGMYESGENAALTFEPFFAIASLQSDVRELDRHLAFEAPVVALCQ